MTRKELIKQAYAYGAAVALQELGYDVNTAQNAGIKLAEEAEEEGMSPALRALIGTGVGLGGGALLGAGGGALAGKLTGKNMTTALEKAIAGSKGLGKNPKIQQALSEAAGGVPGAGGPPTGYHDKMRALQDLIHGSNMAGGANIGARGGALAGALGGGLGGGLSGD
jgi:hypothetical protein